ncbi:MAG: ABC transporter permease [Acetobacteraceae bacterium]|nr:ABC transporter permease [Acetobacteraceae bacterium]
MARFIAWRLLRAVLTVLCVALFVAIALRISGDPAVIALGPDAPAAALQAFRAQNGLNLPIPMQIARQFLAMLHGNFGVSMMDGTQALPLVLRHVIPTLEIAVPALLLKLALGIPAGLLAAVRQNSWIDRLVMAGAALGLAVPNFVIGVLLVIVFAVKLGWLPSSGQPSFAGLLLPVISLGLAGAGVLARFTRSAIVGVLTQPHVRAASAKGLSRSAVLLRHVLPNAVATLLPVIGLAIGGLLAGTVVVETLFSWPGLGNLLVVAVANRDVPVVECILILSAATMALSNLVMDVAHAWRDPRIVRGRG